MYHYTYKAEMALDTHHLQGSYRTCPLRSSSWSSQNTLRGFVTKFHTFGQKDQFISLKGRSFLRKRVPLVHKPKGQSLKISAYKSNSQNQSGGRAGESNSLQNSVKLSYVSQESEETSVESTSTQNIPISYHAEADETTYYSSIRTTLRSWLTLLHTPSINKIMNETLEETTSSETLENQNLIQKKENGEFLKMAWRRFQILDATIKICILVFLPLYLAVTLVYGAKVSRDLTPLWILGPCLVALDIKMLESIGAVYAFCFKKTVYVVKTFQTYYLLACNCISHGKVRENMRACLSQLVEDFRNSEYKKLAIRNSEYKKLAKSKVKDFKLFLVEKYLDFLELLWPYYCRTRRFIKGMNI